MPFNLAEFIANLQGSGARPNLFQVELTFPASAPDANASKKITFLAEAASIPHDHLGVITAYYFGRELKYPGDRRFEPWSIQIINDEDFLVKKAFERWMNSLNMHEGNLRSPAAATPVGYQADAVVKQYSKIGGEPVAEYKMLGCWPSDLTQIELAWESVDSLEKFQVTLQYQYWTNSVTT